MTELREELRAFSSSSVAGASRWPEPCPLPSEILTLGKAWWVVVDVREGDVDRRGPRQPPQLPAHVFGLDDDLVVLFGFSVHVHERCPDDT